MLNDLKKINTEKFEVTLIEKGIIENVLMPSVIIDEKDVLELKEHNFQIAAGEPYALLVIPGHLTTITKEAKELLAQKDFVHITFAKALLIKSAGHKLVGNFYLKINKPHTNTKIFSDRLKALIWLRSFIK